MEFSSICDIFFKIRRISPVTIANCEIFHAKLYKIMLWFNFMVLGLKVYCPSLF